MAACLAGTPRRVKSLLTSFLHSSSMQEQESDQKETSSGGEEKGKMCLPRSKEAFWSRVETFTPFTWFAKPFELSPLHCALYGWENADVDILQCVSCKTCLDATMSANWDPDMYAKTCQQLKDAIVSDHTKFCPWPDNPCPESFLCLPTNTSEQWKTDFLSRWQVLMGLGSHLPELDPNTYEDMEEVTEGHIDELQKVVQSSEQRGAGSDYDDGDQDVRTACLIALCGWYKRSSESEPDGNILFCAMCRREVGLWNFRSLGSPSATTSQSDRDRLDDPSETLEAMTMSDDTSSENTSTIDSERPPIDDSTPMDVAAGEPSSRQKGFLRGFLGHKRSRDIQSSSHESEANSDNEDESMEMGMELKLRLQGVVPESRGDKRGSGPGPSHGSRGSDWPMVMGDTQSREGLPKELLQLPIRPFSGRSSPLPGRYGPEVLTYRSPLHHSLSDLSDKGHCESLCVEVEEESLTEKLQAVEAELEFMTGGTDSSVDREDYAPERKRIRLEDIEKGRFHPLSEHRNWCPWVTCVASVRGQPGGQIGWKLLLYTILPNRFPGKEHSLVESPPQEAWKSVRKVLTQSASSISSSTSGHSK